MGNVETQCQGNRCGVECPFKNTEWDVSQGEEHSTSSFVRRHKVLSDPPDFTPADAADGAFEKTPSFTEGAGDGGWGDDALPPLPSDAPPDGPRAPASDGPVSGMPAVLRTPPASARGGKDCSAETSVPPASGGEQHSDGVGSGRTARDWVRDQDQFKHMPVLPEGWIYVRSKNSGEIYYYCLDTGEATFHTPSDLPAGWVAMKSRTTGQTYYWNAQLRVSQFMRPNASDATTPRGIQVPSTIHE